MPTALMLARFFDENPSVNNFSWWFGPTLKRIDTQVLPMGAGG